MVPSTAGQSILAYPSCECDGGSATLTILPTIDCNNATSFAGNIGYPVQQPINFGTDTGSVVISCNAASIPDRFMMIYNGQVAADSGYRGSTNFQIGGIKRNDFTASLSQSADPLTGQIYPFANSAHDSDGYPTVTSPGNTSITFDKNISNVTYKREDFSLPNDKFIFCCFNNNYKYNPLIFNSWMNILRNSSDSVLWLYITNNFASENILFEAEKKGISRDRIFFAKNLKSKNHLRRLQLGDLFLDTFPYNAHTSASDALRMQVPLVTLSGRTFASRVAGSILSQLNLSELITNQIKEYEDLAIKLCNDKSKYLSVKKKISKNVKSTSLFNPESYTKDLEKIYFDLIKYN